MPSLAAQDFSLEASCDSGQAFRWRRHQDWLYGFIDRRLVRIRQSGDQIEYASDKPLSPKTVTRYFALDLDLDAVIRSIDTDVQIHKAIAKHRGLRILRQDPWETLASFVCSSFNNIRRIEGMLEGLAQTYGEPVALNGYRTFSFPEPERIARSSEKALRSLGLGYRASYLLQTARRITQGGLSLKQLAQSDYRHTKQALLSCDGVGDKVADCVALFGFEKYEAFPIDVWIERAMRYYFRHKKATRSQMHAFARRRFGKHAGYAQQYLYHYMRNLDPLDRRW